MPIPTVSNAHEGYNLIHVLTFIKTTNQNFDTLLCTRTKKLLKGVKTFILNINNTKHTVRQALRPRHGNDPSDHSEDNDHLAPKESQARSPEIP